MSKNFEGEYKEYLNAQAPDLWDRIEAGIDAVATAPQENVVPISASESKASKKKRRIRYQNYRMLVSVAACLFALVLVVPVYFLTRNAGKDAAAEAPMMVADAAIENVEITNEETAVVTNDEAPAQEMVEDAVEVEIALEETQEDAMELVQATQEPAEESVAEGESPVLDDTQTEETGQIASIEAEETDGILPEAAQEEVPAQEDMQITIVGEGAAQEGGVMYTAAVVGSESSSTISVFVPAESAVVLEADKVYNVTAELSEDGTYYVAVAVTAEE